VNADHWRVDSRLLLEVLSPLSNPLRPICRRLAHEERGFTLLELLIVVIVLGILTSIALPSYLSFKDKSRKTAAAANIRNIIEALNAYTNDNFAGASTSTDPDWNGTDASGTGTNADSGWHDGYTGHTMFTLLKAKYNPAIASFTINPTGYSPSPSDSTDFCIYATVGPWYAARRASDTTTTVGKTMTVGPSTCAAS
jgi:prepilin-type N-terminal cleavage/methylation domain-containing protein